MGHGPAVALLEHFDGPIAAAQQVEADAQPDHAGRGVLLLGLEFGDGIAKDGVIGPVAADGRLHLPDFGGTKGTVDQDGLPQVEFDALHHCRFLPAGGTRRNRGCTWSHEPAGGIEPPTPALRMRCSAD